MDEDSLRRAIEDFYLPRHLVKAIFDIGQIPDHSTETKVGIGFIDIADYSYLSKFLSPKENQIVLNGLYTAFQMVLNRHGGYLNKIEGDSMMFHFDGIINTQFKNLQEKEQLATLAKELFYTCVEMQRICALFNQASSKFIDMNAGPEARGALEAAFAIINNLRNNSDASSALSALFQIRIRIGANIGEVTIGNFGPEGAKQWDVIGMPVINAKRMESTAPIGGLRISDEFYNILLANGVVDSYYDRFRREAQAMGSVYRAIKRSELFAYREVVIHEKKNASFKTYSVQVSPNLPELVADQIEVLLNHGESGVNRILELLQYYRGNFYVIDMVEKSFVQKGIKLRKTDMVRFIQPQLIQTIGGSEKPGMEEIEALVANQYSLFECFQLMDGFQDIVQEDDGGADHVPYGGYTSTTDRQHQALRRAYEAKKLKIIQRAYFFDVVYPSVLYSIKNSLLEYQTHDAEALEVEEMGTLEAL